MFSCPAHSPHRASPHSDVIIHHLCGPLQEAAAKAAAAAQREEKQHAQEAAARQAREAAAAKQAERDAAQAQEAREAAAAQREKEQEAAAAAAAAAGQAAKASVARDEAASAAAAAQGQVKQKVAAIEARDGGGAAAGTQAAQVAGASSGVVARARDIEEVSFRGKQGGGVAEMLSKSASSNPWAGGHANKLVERAKEKKDKDGSSRAPAVAQAKLFSFSTPASGKEAKLPLHMRITDLKTAGKRLPGDVPRAAGAASAATAHLPPEAGAQAGPSSSPGAAPATQPLPAPAHPPGSESHDTGAARKGPVSCAAASTAGGASPKQFESRRAFAAAPLLLARGGQFASGRMFTSMRSHVVSNAPAPPQVSSSKAEVRQSNAGPGADTAALSGPAAPVEAVPAVTGGAEADAAEDIEEEIEYAEDFEDEVAG